MDTPSAIETFLHDQVAAWNAGDRVAFFESYRRAAPEGLTIEYVGRGPAADGWPVLEAMWAQQNAKFRIEELVCIVNEREAACHNRNRMREADSAIETVELYRFDQGRLHVRYFIRMP